MKLDEARKVQAEVMADPEIKAFMTERPDELTVMETVADDWHDEAVRQHNRADEAERRAKAKDDALNAVLREIDVESLTEDTLALIWEATDPVEVSATFDRRIKALLEDRFGAFRKPAPENAPQEEK